MNKLFVSYDIAKKLKELGFDLPCCKNYYTGDTVNNVDRLEECVISKAKNFNSDSLCVSVPMYHQVVDWFFEKHSTDISIISKLEYDTVYLNGVELDEDDWAWYFTYQLTRISQINERETFEPYQWYISKQEALNEAIEKGIELIIKYEHK